MIVGILLAAVVATMPNPALTPGVSRSPELTVAVICSTKWGKDERAVTEAMKLQVFHEYGYTGDHDPKLTSDAHGRTAEIDHLRSRETGGADAIPNMWVEPYAGPWNASDKDREENFEHAQICSGKETPEQAWANLDDWQFTYIKDFGGPPADAVGVPPTPGPNHTK